jgi:RHS repeat-associated protein
VLVSLTAFDDAGNVATTTDPMGTVTCIFYDAAGREEQRILNCKAASSSSSSSSSPSSSSASSSSSGGLTGPCPPSADTNLTFLRTYNADGNVASITALNSATGNQTTQYLYGTTPATSGVASSLLLAAVVYPDSVGGSDQVSLTYNRQGQPTTKTDQNGTVHSILYDLLGRPINDCVTTLGAGVDGTVLRIETAYEVRGMVETVTQYDNATVGQGNIVNQVQFASNSFGQLTADYQSHAGAVNTATTPACQYAFADGSANTIRPTSITYPNGRTVNENYSPAGGMNDALSRVGSLIDNDGITHLADYSYLGLAGIVEVNEPQPGLSYTLLGLGSGNDPVTGDIYQGLDLFGRIKDLIWRSSGGSSSSSSSSSSGSPNVIERIQHGYDRLGHRLWRKELADPSELHDELYALDGIYRLKDLQRGTLNATQTAITPETFAQCWGLDETGNWQSFRQDDTGAGIWDLAQMRTVNPANEIVSILPVVGPAWAMPGYDKAGNLTAMPQPSAPTQALAATYDAWYRLVGLSASGTTVAAYQYDGFGRRVVKQTYSGGVLNQTRHVYFSEGWQPLEERVGTATTAERQFVWGLRYLDDLVLRDRDATGDGVLNERLYALQDANGNVTAIADSGGNVQERYGYDAYGLPTVLTPTFGLRSATLWDWETRYAGYRWDAESGLYQVRHRFYNAVLGCWLSRDPLGGGLQGAGLSLYLYVKGNPVSAIDPLGLLRIPGPAPAPSANGVGALRFAGPALLEAAPAAEAGGGTAAAAGIGAGASTAITLGVALAAAAGIVCSIQFYRHCMPEFELCFQAAVQMAVRCVGEACKERGFKDGNARDECLKKYAQKFAKECVDNLLTCAETCAIKPLLPPLACQPNLCTNLCCEEEEEDCHCCVFDPDKKRTDYVGKITMADCAWAAGGVRAQLWWCSDGPDCRWPVAPN